jgi:hypothetical protein
MRGSLWTKAASPISEPVLPTFHNYQTPRPHTFLLFTIYHQLTLFQNPKAYAKAKVKAAANSRLKTKSVKTQE